MSSILDAKTVKLRDADGKVIAPRTKASIVEMEEGVNVQEVVSELLEKIAELEAKVAEYDQANLLELNVPEQE